MKNIVKQLVSVFHTVVYCSLQLLSRLTVFDVLWSDATDGCPVVCHLLCGFHVFVIDAFPKVVHEGHASQDAVLSVRTDSHHLAIDGHGSGEANGRRMAYSVLREDSLHYYINLPEKDLLSLFVTYCYSESALLAKYVYTYKEFDSVCICIGPFIFNANLFPQNVVVFDTF